MRLYLLLIALPVLGLPGPKHKRSSTPASWWSPSASPSSSPIKPGTIGWSSTPQYSPTPAPSSSVPVPSPPQSSSPPIPSESLLLPPSSSIVGSTKANGGLSTNPSHSPKLSSTAGKSSTLFSHPSSTTSHYSSKNGPGPHSTSSRTLSSNESSDPTSSGQLHPSRSTGTNPNQSTTLSSQSSTRKAHSPTRSLSPGAAPDWTPTDKFHSPGAPYTDSQPTKSRSLSPGAAPEWTYSKTQTSDENGESATRSYSLSENGETGAQTYSETGTTGSMITPDPSTVTISETETIEGVEENTVYKTEKDGHETSIPILFGAGCLIFCNTGALLLWGIGPHDGKFELPPIPGIAPLPKIIDIKGGIPTPQGTQGSDSEPTESLVSQTEESSDALTSEGTTSSESTSSESTTTVATTTESTSTCTRATITNCGITTSCGPKTCSTITSCEPTVTDCTATGTTVSTTTSEKYELAMDVYTGSSLATPSPSSSSTSNSPSYDLTMAVYSGDSLATPSQSSTPYELTMAVYSGYSLATPSRSSIPYELTMAVYSGYSLATPSRSSTPYELTMAVYSGHSLATPSRSSTPYELTMAVYSGHSLATPSQSSTPASSTPPYQLTMAIYTGHAPTKSSTFRTYQITTTMIVGDSLETTKATKTKFSPSKVTKISPSTEKPSCYPKLGDTEEYKVLTIENSRLKSLCGDPTQVFKNTTSQDPPRVDYIEAGWSLDDDAPEPCSDLPTMEGKSGGYWVCKFAFIRIARACPWNGGTIRNECGEFRLRGCIGPCNN